MMFWLGVAGAVLGAIYLVIVDNKDDFWMTRVAFWVAFFMSQVWFFC